MARAIGIGNQDFELIRKEGYFYIDKTKFIREWWETGDSVTLITRPRRFGKTLNMSMVEKFFSVEYQNRGELFECLSIWQDKKYRNLQGTYPVLFLSFADIKETTFQETRKKICKIIQMTYNKYDFLLKSDVLNTNEKKEFQQMSTDMENHMASLSLKMLSDYLCRYYDKKVIILLDEYDTPMQEAYVNGYWQELVAFTRSLFNSTFKTNPYLERAIMTGITRVSKESIFSDLNNLKVVTTTSKKYADCFGFTEDEVFAALEEFGLSNQKQLVKDWYDGFTFGERQDIYNPWSIINFLDEKGVGTYWANSSSNSLVGNLIREGSPEIKMTLEKLLQGETFYTTFDEQIVFNQLDQGDDAVWSLLLASGYLKIVHYEFNIVRRKAEYALKLTNLEVQVMFEQMIESWFSGCRKINNAFLQALLADDVKAMNLYMNKVTLEMFSYFDTGKRPSWEAPERFYHGFVLGLMVELSDRYVITSNRESGFGRYDIMIEPKTMPRTAVSKATVTSAVISATTIPEAEATISEAAIPEAKTAASAAPISETASSQATVSETTSMTAASETTTSMTLKGRAAKKGSAAHNAMIIEFKVQDEEEKDLSDTVQEALRQIDEMDYQSNLIAKGFPKECIRKYGFAFCGKKVLIGCAKKEG